MDDFNSLEEPTFIKVENEEPTSKNGLKDGYNYGPGTECHFCEKRFCYFADKRLHIDAVHRQVIILLL